MRECSLKKGTKFEKNIFKKLPICGITPFTLQDFPGETACILWFAGCNFRCAYCHNPELILGKKKRIPIEEVWEFLESRKDLLRGVVLSGGECTMSSAIEEFSQKLKRMGFKVKLDTNGSHPFLLKSLVEKNLIDYIALDYKAPMSKFEKITRFKNKDYFFKSLGYLCDTDMQFEVRTTIHTDLINEEDIIKIIEDLDKRGFKGSLYLQNFAEGRTLSNLPSQKRLLDFSKLITPKNFVIERRNFA